MALSTTPVDTNRGTNYASKLLPKTISDEIIAKAQEESVIMQLAPQVAMAGSGVTIPIITGDATADWVNETAEKPVSKAAVDAINVTPAKVAVIELFSNEFKRDMPRVYEELVRRAPAAIAAKFDATIFNGTAPNSGFSVLTNSTAVNIQSTTNHATVYKNLVTALGTVAGHDYSISGWAMAPKADPILLSEVDGNGRPIFIANPEEGAIGSVLGAPVYRSRNVYKQGADADVLGFAGDWQQARWGIVDGINIAVSEEATINDGTNQINLWQRNMFAVRVEAELAFAVADANAFVKLTGTGTGN